MYRTFLAVVDRLIVWVTGIAVITLIVGMVVSIVLGVFFRYVLASALPWPEEFARFAMIWVTMLGSGLVLRYTGHIAVTFLVDWLPQGVRLVVDWLGRLLIAAFLLLLLRHSFEMVHIAAPQAAPAMGISMAIPNLALPLGALLMLYHLAIVTFARQYPLPPLFSLLLDDEGEDS